MSFDSNEDFYLKQKDREIDRLKEQNDSLRTVGNTLTLAAETVLAEREALREEVEAYKRRIWQLEEWLRVAGVQP